MALIVLTVIIVLLWLTSCSAKKTVTEYVFVHDTVASVRIDTVRDVRVSVQHDTIREKEMHTYTLNNVGDTIREIHHYHDREKVKVIDLTDRYQTKIDSLQKIVDSKKEKETVRTKIKLPWKWMVFVAACVLLFILIVSYDRNK